MHVYAIGVIFHLHCLYNDILVAMSGTPANHIDSPVV